MCGRTAIVACDALDKASGTIRDFCADCIDAGHHIDNFGRCYQCRDGYHDLCIGVPCQCPCPTPAQVALQAERMAALDKLTPRERAILGMP